MKSATSCSKFSNTLELLFSCKFLYIHLCILISSTIHQFRKPYIATLPNVRPVLLVGVLGERILEGNIEQKLLCVGCNARLGSFNWAGMQCSCGTWVNPAFQLHKNRIDECPL
ncbi:hypothetical protein MKW94_011840 [Papaver nudicaule]|uniref:Uncharacterized protein n=1 Tax=Papaver nudicaule TaxID=74823 RepID=A0AA41S7N2_PAPNU|nr:hypothetical protein [Papaver nudicaule]